MNFLIAFLLFIFVVFACMIGVYFYDFCTQPSTRKQFAEFFQGYYRKHLQRYSSFYEDSCSEKGFGVILHGQYFQIFIINHTNHRLELRPRKMYKVVQEIVKGTYTVDDFRRDLEAERKLIKSKNIPPQFRSK